MKTEYLLFIGQNASTGTPHPITGRMSFWGDYKKFATKESRKEYVDNLCLYLPKFATMGTRRTLRKYSLGCSIETYSRCLDWLETEGTK